LRLRGEPERRLAGAVLGLDLSGAPGAAVRHGDRAALRLGPDEWLVLCPRSEESRLGEELRRALDGYSGAAASIGNGTAVIEVSGPRSRQFLAKGTAIDLHPGVFAVGRCAVTGFGKIRVALWRRDTDRYALHVGRSFARSFWDWAVDVALEWER
jgi:sarcosine oxidase, subunit gamma